ncbi:MAG: DUF4271 domain-containing protein [Chitinophagaceae bacterium]
MEHPNVKAILILISILVLRSATAVPKGELPDTGRLGRRGDTLHPQVGQQPLKKNISAGLWHADTLKGGPFSHFSKSRLIGLPLASPSFGKVGDSMLTASLTGYPDFNQWLIHTWPANQLIKRNPSLEPDMETIRPHSSSEFLFYLLTGIILVLAIIRQTYSKYFIDLFRAFLNPTLSNRQLKDQLSQTPLPSLLLNIFFAISAGTYFFLMLRYFKFIESYDPLLVVATLVILVGLVYLVKFLLLRICGWLFGIRELVDGYLFILFLINKITSILLLPFLVILAFCSPNITFWSVYISISLIMLLIAYRYMRSYGLVKNHISFSKFHFILYLCAFEIAPVLIIAKVVLIWLNGNV